MKLPESWAGVTIGQYHQLITISNLYKDDEVERQIKILALFSGKSVDEVEQMKAFDMVNHVKRLDFLKELPPEKNLRTTFMLKGKKYKACLLQKDMKAGQFIDFSNAGKGCSADELPYHMHELIACMCLTKRGKLWGKYIYEGYTETSDTFLEMPMSIAYPYYVFFCNVLTNLQKPIAEYSQRKLKKAMRQVRRMTKTLKQEGRLKNIGAGIVCWMGLVTTILLNGML